MSGDPRGARGQAAAMDPRVPRLFLLTVLALTSMGCEPMGDGGSEITPVEAALLELEALAFVPRGETRVVSRVDARSDVDLLVDRYEVTWAHWDRHRGGGMDIPASFRPDPTTPDAQASPPEWLVDVPAVGMTLPEARTFAARRRMAVPSFQEWMWCAVGQNGRRTPAGPAQRGSANTLELGLDRPTPVGAFESGRTPDHGVYDLLGNVWEWIDAPPRSARAGTPEGPAGDAARSWCLGGSFRTSNRPIYDSNGVCFAIEVAEDHRADDLGLRCVAPARTFLGGLPVGEALSQDQVERLRLVGERWGPGARRLLALMAEDNEGGAWVPAIAKGLGR